MVKTVMILFLEKWTMTSGRWTQIKSRWLEEVFMKLGRNVKTCPDRNLWNFPKKSKLTRQIQEGTSSFRWRWPSLSLLSRSHIGGRCREEVSLTMDQPSAKWVIGFVLQTFQTVPVQCNAEKLWKPFRLLVQRLCCNLYDGDSLFLPILESTTESSQCFAAPWLPLPLSRYISDNMIILSSCKYHFNWYFYLYTLDIFML